MKNIDKIRSETISYIQSSSADELYTLFSFLNDYGFDCKRISPYYFDCDICEKLYGHCGDEDLSANHCREMFMRYCNEDAV
ncbi:MAG: hypothetical protein SOX32_07885 [Candidatus Choladocola sp.]|nr:hypothetical protein [Candidatus Choladocola sp.]